eukprot:1160112-Pelagomonas_calceolata.AAC.8
MLAWEGVSCALVVQIGICSIEPHIWKFFLLSSYRGIAAAAARQEAHSDTLHTQSHPPSQLPEAQVAFMAAYSIKNRCRLSMDTKKCPHSRMEDPKKSMVWGMLGAIPSNKDASYT